jgi:hypothetical protein
MPRFAILSHDHPFPHWDLLLEENDVCRTWRLLSSIDSAKVIAAEQMFDHRLMYLDYAGPISGGRGHVTQWDRGTYERLDEQDDSCMVRLTGDRWQGLIRLTSVDGVNWSCVALSD